MIHGQEEALIGILSSNTDGYWSCHVNAAANRGWEVGVVLTLGPFLHW